MAFRLASLGRQAKLEGGFASLFDGTGNGMRVRIRGGTPPTDVDDLGTGTIIVLFAGTDGTYGTIADDGTTASIPLGSTISANASADWDFNSSTGDGVAYAEIFQGSTLDAAHKVGDFTVGGPNTTGTQDLELDNDDVVNGGLLILNTATLTSV